MSDGPAGQWDQLWREPLIWQATRIRGESLMFVAADKNQPAAAYLLFEPDRILAVRSANRSAVFEPERDFRVETGGRRLVATVDSRLPQLTREQLLPVEGPHRSRLTIDGQPRAVWHVEGCVYHDLQVEIDYERCCSDWPGRAPEYFGHLLPRTMHKLDKGKPLKIVLFGDSISAGGNASGCTGAPPHMPAYGELLRCNLANHYQCEVTLTNVSQGGMASLWGHQNIARVTEHDADLVILAWGMNDASEMVSPWDYAGYITAQMQAVRAVRPDSEFILVATMTPNSDWVHYAGGLYSRYLAELEAFAGPGAAVANVTDLWIAMTQRKPYWELLANGVNHPNDFGHRLYAQTLLAGLIADDARSS